MMDSAEADVLAYMAFPAARRAKLHPANPIERVNGEIKRRTNTVGIFPNEAAVVRLVGVLLLAQSDEWAAQRSRTMSLAGSPPYQPDQRPDRPRTAATPCRGTRPSPEVAHRHAQGAGIRA